MHAVTYRIEHETFPKPVVLLFPKCIVYQSSSGLRHETLLAFWLSSRDKISSHG